MTSFLSQLLSISDASEAAASTAPAVESRPKKASQRFNGGQAKAVLAQVRYANHFAKPETIAKASARMGIGHVACLNQVYRYEKRGWMTRLPNPDPYTGGRGLLFVWIRKKKLVYRSHDTRNQNFTYRASNTRK